MTDRDRRGEQPPPPRSRLEDEVLEILVRTDQPTSLRDHVRRKTRQRRRSRVAAAARSIPSLGTRFGPGSYLVGCLILALLATLVDSTSPLLAQLLAIGSIASLVMVWVSRYRTPGGSEIKQWRGRDIDLRPPPPPWVESLRDRLRRPPRQ